MLKPYEGDDKHFLPIPPELGVIAEQRADIERLRGAVDLLRRMADRCNTTTGYHDDPCCFFCGEEFLGYRDQDERHKPDCAYVAAKAFLASLEEPTDG